MLNQSQKLSKTYSPIFDEYSRNKVDLFTDFNILQILYAKHLSYIQIVMEVSYE